MFFHLFRPWFLLFVLDLQTRVRLFEASFTRHCLLVFFDVTAGPLVGCESTFGTRALWSTSSIFMLGSSFFDFNWHISVISVKRSKWCRISSEPLIWPIVIASLISLHTSSARLIALDRSLKNTDRWFWKIVNRNAKAQRWASIFREQRVSSFW